MGTFIIAEIGTAHSGNIQKAFELIDAAKSAGCDCVKFQWVYADEILHPDTGFVNLPNGKTRLYDTFKSLEVDSDFFKQCLEYTHQWGMKFCCSPFGIKSLEELAAINPDAIKIASPEVNHIPLLEACAKYYGKIPIILSSGVSKLGDLEKAVSIIQSSGIKTDEIKSSQLKPLTLLHCITSYPAPEEEYNVKCVKTLSEIFGIPSGISDHSLDPILVPCLSAAMGGTVIEKHITLSKSDSGLDDPVALEPEQFAAMVHSVHQTNAIMEKAKKNFDDSSCFEKGVAEVIRQLSVSFDEERIKKVLGNGVKKLAQSEIQNYGRTNRSLHYLKNMKKGDVVHSCDIGILRTEKILTPGISPEFMPTIEGARLTRNVTGGEGILIEHFIQKD